MDNLFLNRVNSWQGLVKKEQKSIFEKSIGLPHNLKMFFEDAISAMRLFFLWASLSASTQQERSLSHSNSTRFKKRSSIPLTLKDTEEKLLIHFTSCNR
jgi:hypothetical protein